MRIDGITVSAFMVGVIAALVVNAVFWDMPNRAGLVTGPWPFKP